MAWVHLGGLADEGCKASQVNLSLVLSYPFTPSSKASPDLSLCQGPFFPGARQMAKEARFGWSGGYISKENIFQAQAFPLVPLDLVYIDIRPS